MFFKKCISLVSEVTDGENLNVFNVFLCIGSDQYKRKALFSKGANETFYLRIIRFFLSIITEYNFAEICFPL